MDALVFLQIMKHCRPRTQLKTAEVLVEETQADQANFLNCYEYNLRVPCGWFQKISEKGINTDLFLRSHEAE